MNKVANILIKIVTSLAFIFWGLITIVWLIKTCYLLSGALYAPYGLRGIVAKGADIHHDAIKISADGKFKFISVEDATELVSAGYLFYIGLIYAEIIFAVAYFLVKYKRRKKDKLDVNDIPSG